MPTRTPSSPTMTAGPRYTGTPELGPLNKLFGFIQEHAHVSFGFTNPAGVVRLHDARETAQ
ncbi:MAG: hypothetical protein WBZ37_25520 [Mycobacterium sp.]